MRNRQNYHRKRMYQLPFFWNLPRKKTDKLVSANQNNSWFYLYEWLTNKQYIIRTKTTQVYSFKSTSSLQILPISRNNRTPSGLLISRHLTLPSRFGKTLLTRPRDHWFLLGCILSVKQGPLLKNFPAESSISSAELTWVNKSFAIFPKILGP